MSIREHTAIPNQASGTCSLLLASIPLIACGASRCLIEHRDPSNVICQLEGSSEIDFMMV